MSHDHPHFPDHHGDHDGVEEEGGPPLTWELDNVELVTVGVDVGSSTSHLLFSRLHLQRLAQSLSSRFVVVARETLHRSAILLTPFSEGELIDAGALQEFVERAYEEAGLSPGEIDTGAVILTGVALERRNSRAVAELFAASGGGFVCASAGDNLEAILAAHGSGAVARSRDLGGRRLHLDIGGGTTKLALLEGGEILRTRALRAGGRLVVVDDSGRVVRLEAAALEQGIPIRLGAPFSDAEMGALAERLAERMVDAMVEMGAGALLPATCSGGVSEYIYGRETKPFGDLSVALARCFLASAATRGITIEEIPGGECIRATAIGASQFTIQVSGNTVHISNPEVLPLRNLPVVRPRLPAGEPSEERLADAVAQAFERLDLDPTAGPCALSLPWSGEPRHGSLRALAGGVQRAMAGTLEAGLPLVLALEADIGRSLGAILREEFDVSGPLVCIDGLELAELDYVDIGAILRPAGVVPVVVKSLAFPVSPAPFGLEGLSTVRPGAPRATSG